MKFGGHIHLDREQALSILRELASKDLVEPSFLHISERMPNHYQIQIKCDYKKIEIEEFAKKHGLTIIEDKERKYLIIFKP